MSKLISILLLIVVTLGIASCGTNANDVAITQEHTNRLTMERLLNQQEALIRLLQQPQPQPQPSVSPSNAPFWGLLVVLVVILVVGGYVVVRLVQAHNYTTQAAITALSRSTLPLEALPSQMQQWLITEGLAGFPIRVNPMSQKYEIVDYLGRLMGTSHLTVTEFKQLEDKGEGHNV
jgi:hypothetical protein